MKRIALFCGVILVAASIIFVGCKKEQYEATIDKFFKIDNATLIQQDMPAPTSNQTIDVAINGSVIPGGSSYVTVASESVTKKILIGLVGQTGYWEYIPRESNRDYSYSFIMYIDQNITLPEGQTGLTVQVAVVDENGNISQIWGAPVEVIEVGTGGLQVSLTFDNAKDVDLHLIEPEYDNEGESVPFYGRHIYYSNHWSLAGGELDLDSNPGCSIDNINNENITYDDEIATIVPGTYKVYVDLFENCDPSIATNYVVTVFYGGALIASRSGRFEVDAESTHNPISEEYVEANDPFLTFTINQGHKGNGNFQPGPMTQSAIEKEAMAAHK
ncbi:MAG: hypothetical protein K6F96_00480 [Bacteroidales bacterium]|nr:hypothetical protein [Bacteroidales bacterium]